MASATSTAPSWHDAHVASLTSDDKYIITTPNMDFVPDPQIGIVKVIVHDDCRYGAVDPIQWPQVISHQWEYLCAVRQRVSSRHRLVPVWWDPQERDFSITPGSEFKNLGLLTRSSLVPLMKLAGEMFKVISARPGPTNSHLHWLRAAMRQACNRLLNFPSTYRDAVSQVR